MIRITPNNSFFQNFLFSLHLIGLSFIILILNFNILLGTKKPICKLADFGTGIVLKERENRANNTSLPYSPSLTNSLMSLRGTIWYMGMLIPIMIIIIIPLIIIIGIIRNSLMIIIIIMVRTVRFFLAIRSRGSIPDRVNFSVFSIKKTL
jgi:hypothetical protein